MTTDSTCHECGLTAELSGGLCTKCQSIHNATIAPSTSNKLAPNGGVPSEVGEYEIIEEIARGGMGIIYKARHRQLNRTAALKMILSGRFSSEEELKRFHIEAEAAAKLDHSAIVPVYEIGEFDGQAFFAMKFVEGGSLAEKLGEFKADNRRAMQMLSKVARAVHHAHQRGVLHRDLKPANILIDTDGEPLITDLGLAKSTANDSNLTNTGAILGTPSYMPPEQAAGAGVTTSVDIYSLGAIMYELLTGQPPYKGETAIETVMQVIEGPPPPPSTKVPSVDRGLQMICMKCLEPEPDNRYASADALADDLDAWLAGSPLSVKPPTMASRVRMWLDRNRRLVFATFAVLIGILISLPFALTVLTERRYQRVYDYFPDADRPFLFKQSNSIPDWVGAACTLFLILVLWPAIGWLTALITKPKSAKHAAVVGALTSVLMVVMFGLMMGWVVVVKTTTSSSQDEIQTLARAVWPPDQKSKSSENDEASEGGQNGSTPDEMNHLQFANKMFEGIEDIPEDKRADAVADRILADQMAIAPLSVVVAFVGSVFASIPIILGTVLGYFLLQRGNWFWVSYIRYTFAWWGIIWTAALSVGVFLQSDGLVNINGYSVLPTLIALVIFIGMTWLALRRWRKESPEPDQANLPTVG